MTAPAAKRRQRRRLTSVGLYAIAILMAFVVLFDMLGR